MAQLHFSVPEKIAAEIRRRAKARGVSASRFVAAVSLDERRSIADPFLPTANVVELLLKLAS